MQTMRLYTVYSLSLFISYSELVMTLEAEKYLSKICLSLGNLDASLYDHYNKREFEEVFIKLKLNKNEFKCSENGF